MSQGLLKYGSEDKSLVQGLWLWWSRRLNILERNNWRSTGSKDVEDSSLQQDLCENTRLGPLNGRPYKIQHKGGITLTVRLVTCNYKIVYKNKVGLRFCSNFAILWINHLTKQLPEKANWKYVNGTETWYRNTKFPHASSKEWGLECF
jgi:hypothetical protein